MNLTDRLKSITDRISQQGDHIQTEEATKHAFILPLIQALGYDVFNPTEVVPEFTADIGTKKGEKIDYCIMVDGKPAIVIECKTSEGSLTKAHNSQLFRYFAACDARIAILTNGIIYRFYSDLDAPNVMDDKPFIQIDMTSLDDSAIETLTKFSKPAFDLDRVLSSAADLKYTNEVKRIMAEELTAPSPEFVRHFASKVYSGRLTQSVMTSFAEIITSALNGYINDKINSRLRHALIEETPQSNVEAAEESPAESSDDSNDGIVTTEEEIEGFFAVKSCLHGAVDPARITHRDAKSYFAILLDDNNRKTICRLHFNRSQKFIAIMNEDRTTTKHPVDSVDGIYEHRKALQDAVRRLAGGNEKGSASPEGAE